VPPPSLACAADGILTTPHADHSAAEGIAALRKSVQTTAGFPQPLSITWEASMLHFLWMFIIGIVVGAIARFIVPGAQTMGIIMTAILGIAGSFIGGFIARIFSRPPEGTPFHPAGILLSIIGAVILLFAWTKFAT
jgi:uncharacterized membrane protein YeaQ/YmgE (transglycosylase-associated protein family)